MNAEMEAFAEISAQYRHDQADMIAKRTAMEKAVQEKLAAQRKFMATGIDFTRAAEALADAMLAARNQP